MSRSALAWRGPVLDRDGAARALVADGKGVLRVAAPLTFLTVPVLHPLGLAQLRAASGELTLDLSGVTEVDSAGLALLVDWLAAARAQGRALHFNQVPEQLQALATLSELEPLLSQ